MKRIVPALVATIAMLLPAGHSVHAASCNGASHQITLASPGASPGSGPPGTTVVFRVTYTDSADCAPSSLTVTVSGVGTFNLDGPSSGFAAGVVYRVAVTLGTGTYAYSFTATSGTGNGVKSATIAGSDPASVVIATPPTTPPTPVPLPPTAVPPPVTPRPPAPQPPPPAITPDPTASADATPSTEPTGLDSPSVDPSPGDTPPAGSAEPSPTAETAAVVHDSWPRPKPSTAAPTPTGWGPLMAPFPISLPTPILAYLISTTAGVSLFFLMLRRRPVRPETGVVRQVVLPAVASEAEAAPTPVSPLPPMRELIPPVDYDLLRDPDARIEPRPDEVGVPRWLRGSLREARIGPRDPRRLRGWD